MRKISDYRDGDALDLLADIMEPAITIMADPVIRQAFDEGSRVKGISAAIKRHKDEVMQILARLEGVDVEEYHCNVLSLPGVIMEILSDGELIAFFTKQAQTMTTVASSGAAMADTQADVHGEA